MTLKEFAQTIISVGKLQEEQVSLSNIGNGERKLLHYYCSLFQKELLNFFKMLQKQRNAFLKNVNTCSIQEIPIPSSHLSIFDNANKLLGENGIC